MTTLLTELVRELAIVLRRDGHRLVTAESCTGGWLAQSCTDLAGSSVWFERGFVTYSNAAKQEMLGVSEEVLTAHGAVSEAVVREMARGALAHAHAERAVAISGIAGPGGGRPDKPVGTVWFAWAGPGGSDARVHRFYGDRATVRYQAVITAVRGLLDGCGNH